MQPILILASSSPYRRELLSRLGVEFRQYAPDLDESPQQRETPMALAQRLAAAKATALARDDPTVWILASDQVAELNGEPLGKPGGEAAAITQLQRCSGKTVVFHTAVCLQQGSQRHAHVDHTQVRFRNLSDAEIRRYVAAENPYDCAGSFKAEGLGIALFERIESRDPTALIGLPLIRVAEFLRRAGFQIP